MNKSLQCGSCGAWTDDNIGHETWCQYYRKADVSLPEQQRWVGRPTTTPTEDMRNAINAMNNKGRGFGDGQRVPEAKLPETDEINVPELTEVVPLQKAPDETGSITDVVNRVVDDIKKRPNTEYSSLL